MSEQKRFLLEISVGSLEVAVAAQRGGADRIELCREQNVGGLTPSSEVMKEARKRLRIPIYVMIRPRAGNFVYSDEEFAAMRESIELAQRLEMDGVVLGILNAERRVDVVRTGELVEMAEQMEVTFHRAIDEAADPLGAVEAIVETGAERILTSGGRATALEGADTIAKMVASARGRVVILPGAGISGANFREVALRTGATEFHSGLGSALPYGSLDYGKFEKEVRRLAEQITRISQSQPMERKN